MAFGRTIALRFLYEAKTCSGQIRSGSAAAAPSTCTSVFRHLFPDSGVQQRPIIVQAAVPPDRISSPIYGKLFDRIREINDDLLRQNKLAPPPRFAEEERRGLRIATEEMLKASQMETIKSRLRAIPKSSVFLSVFLRICCEASSAEQGPEFARSLDESGAVIVVGNVVFLRPHQVAKAIDRVLPLSLTPEDDPRREELKVLERKKAMIDVEAEASARRELWCGLGFLAAQTSGFIRLTFWELSWDVMEPICFFVTSSYFLAGYVFFMRTLAEPSFEGFFRSRFATKQRKLMKEHNFDLCRFNELRGVFQPSQVKQAATSYYYCDRRNGHSLIGAIC